MPPKKKATVPMKGQEILSFTVTAVTSEWKQEFSAQNRILTPSRNRLSATMQNKLLGIKLGLPDLDKALQSWGKKRQIPFQEAKINSVSPVRTCNLTANWSGSDFEQKIPVCALWSSECVLLCECVCICVCVCACVQRVRQRHWKLLGQVGAK